MAVGYLPERQQLMISMTLKPLAFGEDKIRQVLPWLVSWWGETLPHEHHALWHTDLGIIGLMHNLVCQDARLPLFDPPVVDAAGNRLTLWVPTFLGLNKEVHRRAVGSVISSIQQTSEQRCHGILSRAVTEVHELAGDQVLGSSDGTIPILAEVHRLGLSIYPQVSDLVKVGQGAYSRLLHASASDADSAAGLLISESKSRTSVVLQRAGIPSPTTLSTQDPSDAEQLIKSMRLPLVVKPERGARGEGVHTFVESVAALKKAIDAAIRTSPVNIALVQQQLSGDCHRVQVINGKAMWASTRFPKSVVADGKSTVEQLVGSANQKLKEMAARRRLRPFPLDQLADATLRRQGLSKKSVPPAGVRINLRPVTSVADGGDVRSITETLHPANAALCVEAALACGLSTAGIDFFSVDPTAPWFENGGTILEVNYKPQIFNRVSDRANKEISRAFIQELVSGADRVPVYAVIGDHGAAEVAAKHHKELVAKGVNAWLCKSGVIAGPDNIERPLEDALLAPTLLGLMQNPKVEAIVVQVGQWGANLALPLPHVSNIDVSALPPSSGWKNDTWSRVVQRLEKSLKTVE